MKKITFVGIESDRERFLQRLQEAGCTHLIHPAEPMQPTELVRELQRVIEIRKFLARKGPKGSSGDKLDYKELCEKREDLGQQEAALHAEIVLLKKQWATLEPWGDFSAEDVGKLIQKGLQVQFFRLSRKIFDALDLEGAFCKVVSEKGSDVCFATFSPSPVQIGYTEEKLPAQSLSELDREIGYKQAKLEEIEKEYCALAEKLETLEKAEATITDMLEYQKATLNTGRELDDRLFIVQCWSPVPEDELVSKIGGSFSFYHYSEEPDEEDRMPVHMQNSPAFEAGEDLVRIYSFPSHKDFDPSALVLCCFTVFFGMIIGDLGYGLILLGLTVWLQRKFASQNPMAIRLFRLMYVLSGSVIVFGILGAGFFGMKLSPGNPLVKISVMDYGTQAGQKDIMILSILIGMIHICIAQGIKCYRERDFSTIGWIIAIWAAFFYLRSNMADGVHNQPAMYGLIVGLTVVFLFSSKSKNPLIRAAEGLLGLLGVIQIFSDVLSYLRLFALGVATVYIAQTFNILGGEVAQGLPVIGFVFAGIILFIGHTLNIGLAIMGGVIHGLRLNFLEWYRWCFEGDGLEYKPFQRIGER